MSRTRILFASPPWAGHTNQLIVLAGEMVRRGHEVAFANAESFRGAVVKAGAEFLLWEIERGARDVDQVESWRTVWDRASRARSILGGERMMWEVGAEMYGPMHRTLRPIVSEYAPGLVVADSAAVAALDLARQGNIPYGVLAQFLGHHVPIRPEHPRYGTPFRERMNWRERLLNRLHPLKAACVFFPVIRKIERAREECGVRHDWREVYTGGLMMVSSAWGVELPRPVPSSVRMVGPILPVEPEPLGVGLREWLDGAEKEGVPVVYMSFGTLANLADGPMGELVRGLASDRFRVLWSVRGQRAAGLGMLPANFRLEEFVPQLAVLSHPAVRAFVSHCGMNSVSESLYFGKPILGLPVFGDQHYNANRVADIGVGLRLYKERIRSGEVQQSIRVVLNDPGFSAMAERMQMEIRQMRGRERAADLLETIRVSGCCP